MKFFDLHCDTAYECVTRKAGNDLDKGAWHLSLDRGSCFDAWHQIFAVFMPDELRGDAAVAHYRKVRDYIYRQLELFPGRFGLCRDAQGLDNSERTGFCGAILSVEGGSAVAGSLDNLRALYDDGVRLMTLTWNAENELGHGVGSPVGGGLSEFGRSAVALMNELGMIVDVSHLSDAGFADVAELSAKPFVASHSCSRRLCPHRRNLTDEMFGVIRDKGGLVGINFCREFLEANGDATAEHILAHTEHFLSLGGEKVVCMGSDFDGTDMPDGVTGIESIPALYERFLKANYPESLVEDIFFGNAKQFFSAALG